MKYTDDEAAANPELIPCCDNPQLTKGQEKCLTCGRFAGEMRYIRPDTPIVLCLTVDREAGLEMVRTLTALSHDLTSGRRRGHILAIRDAFRLNIRESDDEAVRFELEQW